MANHRYIFSITVPQWQQVRSASDSMNSVLRTGSGFTMSASSQVSLDKLFVTPFTKPDQLILPAATAKMPITATHDAFFGKLGSALDLFQKGYYIISQCICSGNPGCFLVISIPTFCLV